MSEFFKGLKVIELASVLAGPSAGMFFAELGATVIKIENKTQGGDVTRNWRIPDETSKGPSAYYASINFGKQVRFLNLQEKKDQSQLYEMVKESDIVISNFSPRISKKLGVSYQSLQSFKSNLIYIQLNGYFNQDKPAFDVVLQAETGWISMTGSEENPAKLPVALIDVIAGHQIKEAALLGIIKKMRDGSGSYLEVNLEQSALSALANQATNFLMNNHVAKPIGTLHPNIAPYGDWFTTSDGYRIVLAIGSDKHFLDLLESFGLENTPQFNSNQKRLENRDALRDFLDMAISLHSLKQLTEEFNQKGIPFGEVRTLERVLNTSAAKHMIRQEEIEGRATKRLSSLAFTPPT